MEVSNCVVHKIAAQLNRPVTPPVYRVQNYTGAKKTNKQKFQKPTVVYKHKAVILSPVFKSLKYISIYKQV